MKIAGVRIKHIGRKKMFDKIMSDLDSLINQAAKLEKDARELRQTILNPKTLFNLANTLSDRVIEETESHTDKP